MKIILISGKAQHGKDTTAGLLKPYLERKGNSVLVTHFADLLKFICKNSFGWNGEKDEKGRSLLQYVGTDIVRKRKPDFWVEYMSGFLTVFDGQWDYVIIPDVRYPNEISTLVDNGFDVTHIRVFRPHFESPLTEEQRNHISETALDDTAPDIYLENDGPLEQLAHEIQYIAEGL